MTLALMHVHHYSDVLGMNMDMDVVIPEMSRGQIGQAARSTRGKLPVLYLLHGMSDDHTIWQRRTSIERYATEAGFAVVMPTTHLGFYTDMHRGMKWFTYVSQELPQMVPRMFSQVSPKWEDTYVAGLSMGGYGALKCALRAPQVFCCGAALSAAVDIGARYERRRHNNQFMLDVFGPKETAVGGFDDLFAAAEDLKKQSDDLPGIYMWCGTEDFLFEENLRMRDHLYSLGYELTWEQSPGDHQWAYWDQKIQTVLQWLLAGRGQ